MAPTGTRILAFAAALATTACFNSDELAAASGTTGEVGGETVTMYSDESEGENDDNWTAEDTGPAETTCRDAIECLVMCQAAALINPQPEPDLSCLIDCDMGLTTEEAYLLIKLAECIGKKCADEGKCGPESTENDCLICFAANGTDPQPIGCIDEAAACQ
jgi:hypothetical protein